MLNAWDIPKIDAVMEYGNPDKLDRESWSRIKKFCEEAQNTPIDKRIKKIALDVGSIARDSSIPTIDRLDKIVILVNSIAILDH